MLIDVYKFALQTCNMDVFCSYVCACMRSSVGLFNFFQFNSASVKPEFLEFDVSLMLTIREYAYTIMQIVPLISLEVEGILRGEKIAASHFVLSLFYSGQITQGSIFSRKFLQVIKPIQVCLHSFLRADLLVF